MTLVESIEVLSRKQVLEGHADRLRENRHVTYHWYPYSDDCIVKRINDVNDLRHKCHSEGEKEQNNQQKPIIVSTKDKPDFAEERERLLKDDACNRARVTSVNLQEVAYLKKKCSDRLFAGDATDVLSFKCGGSQGGDSIAFLRPKNGLKKGPKNGPKVQTYA